MKSRMLLVCAACLAAMAIGCGTDAANYLVEEATYTAALTEGDGDALEDVGADDPQGEAEESVGDALEEEGFLNGDCSFEGMRQAVIEKYDTNQDGKLTGEELAGLAEDLGHRPLRPVRWARPYRLLRLAWIYDANENGRLDRNERQALRADLEARCEARKAQLIENFDADGDGTLNAAELQAARDALKARIEARRAAILAEYDSNGDGVLDATERAVFIEDKKEELQRRRAEVRVHFDANGDGVLDQAERAALREALRARVRGEHFGENGGF